MFFRGHIFGYWLLLLCVVELLSGADLNAQVSRKPLLVMSDPSRGRSADIFSAKTKQDTDAGAMPLFSINGRVYLVALPSDMGDQKFSGNTILSFGENRWDRGHYTYGDGRPRTLTYSKQAGDRIWTRHVSDSGKFLGYSLTGPDKSIRLVPREEQGMAHEWTNEVITQELGGSGKRRLIAAEGEFQGWYLSFGEPEEIKERTKWKDSDGKSGEMPPHIRYPAILIKEPDEKSLLREIGYYPDGR